MGLQSIAAPADSSTPAVTPSGTPSVAPAVAPSPTPDRSHAPIFTVVPKPVAAPKTAPILTPGHPGGSPAASGKPAPAKAVPPAKPPGNKSPVDWEQDLFMQTMTPEQRQKFLQNMERWKALPPEQRAELRRNEEFRRKRILGEINDAIAMSGLQLDPDQRQLFTFKYAQERRTIEDSLRKEMEQKRRVAVKDLVQQLVTEFHAMPMARAPKDAKPAAPRQTPGGTPGITGTAGVTGTPGAAGTPRASGTALNPGVNGQK